MNNQANSNAIKVYLKPKTHEGNYLLGILLKGNNNYMSKPVVIKKSQHDGPMDPCTMVIDTLRVLYANNRQKKIIICTNRNGLISTYNHLQDWENQGWKASKYTISQMYQIAKAHGKNPSMAQMPKGFENRIPTYKRILKAKKYFPAGIVLKHIDTNNSILELLNKFLTKQIDNMPSTSSFKKRKLVKASSRIIVSVTPKQRKDFISNCQNRNIDYKKYIRDLIINFNEQCTNENNQ